MWKIERSKAFEGFWEIRGKRRPRERGTAIWKKSSRGDEGQRRPKWRWVTVMAIMRRRIERKRKKRHLNKEKQRDDEMRW